MGEDKVNIVGPQGKYPRYKDSNFKEEENYLDKKIASFLDKG